MFRLQIRLIIHRKRNCKLIIDLIFSNLNLFPIDSVNKGKEDKMKKLIGLFIFVFISLGIADIIQGFLLTFIYTPDFYSSSSVEMAAFIKYAISALIVTVALWSVHKLKNVIKSSKSPVKVS